MSASFCSNKPDVGWGRIEKKMLITLVGGWINFQFLLPWQCFRGSVVLFSFFFSYLVTLQSARRRQAVVLP